MNLKQQQEDEAWLELELEVLYQYSEAEIPPDVYCAWNCREWLFTHGKAATTVKAYKQHKEYWKDSEDYLYCLQCHNEDGLNWEEGYTHYLEDCERLELKRWDIYSDSTQDLHLQGELLKHKRYQKKRKHQKDHSTWVWHNEGCWWEIQFKTHKHKKAERVYVEEEWFYCVDFDYDDVFGGDWWTVDPWYAEEVGYGYLVHEEWRDYVGHTGKVLDTWELMAKESEEEDRDYWLRYEE